MAPTGTTAFIRLKTIWRELGEVGIHTYLQIDGRVVSAVVLEESADPMYRDELEIACPDVMSADICLPFIRIFADGKFRGEKLHYMFDYIKEWIQSFNLMSWRTVP